jgi:hypothetical protein
MAGAPSKCFGSWNSMRESAKLQISLMAHPWPLINRCESSKLQVAVTATTMLPATHVKGEGNLQT